MTTMQSHLGHKITEDHHFLIFILGLLENKLFLHL